MSNRIPTRLFLAALLGLALTGLSLADVPHNMSIQGRLADDTGTPLPAGVKAFTFKIFDAETDGTERWPGGAGEDQTIATDGNGLWYAVIGEDVPLPPSVFSDTSCWLEITVDDGVSPPETLDRIKLCSTPWAGYAENASLLGGNQSAHYLDAGNLSVGTLGTDRFSAHEDLTAEGRLDNDEDQDLLTRDQADGRFLNAAGGSVSGDLVFVSGSQKAAEWNLAQRELTIEQALSDLQTSMHGGGFRIRQQSSARVSIDASWVASASLRLTDENFTDRVKVSSGHANSHAYVELRRDNLGLGAVLSGGTTFNGAELTLRAANGITTIILDADGSVALPTGTIDDREILNEPGVSNHVNPSLWVYLNSGNGDYAVDSVTIDIPTSGYVEVTAGCFLNMKHVVGTNTQIFLSINKTRAIADYTMPGSQSYQVPAGVGTTVWQYGATVTRFYSESFAGPKKYYLNADYSSGASSENNIGNTYIRAKFFPTLYGSATVSASDEGGSAPYERVPSDGSVPYERSDLRVITVEEHNAQVAAGQERQRQLTEQRLSSQTDAIHQGSLEEN